MPVINGKSVTLRERLPAKESWDLLQIARKFNENDLEYEPFRDLCVRVVDAWEFPGDPRAPESYDTLDLFTEFLPLVKAVTGLLQTREEQSKN